MTKILAKTLPLIFLTMTSMVYAQKFQTNGSINGTEPVRYKPDDKIVCFASEKDMAKIPMSSELKQKVNARVKGSLFEITYNTGFPDSAKTAFEFATDIWASLFSSPIPIKVNAAFRALDNSNTLGQTGAGSFIANFRNAPQVNTWYQMPIAEKLAGQELNDGGVDIDIEFNSNADWYFDTVNPDSIEGTGKTDFATVALHELAHALGFSAFCNVNDNGVGDITVGSVLDFPMTYTRFIETLAGENLFDELQNNSQTMGDELTSGSLSYRGPTTSVRVYAPNEFSAGSSISHTNQIFNQLMNPSLGPNGYIHDPGLALGMMHDYGWEFTYMIHDPLPSTEDFNQSFEIVAEVFADDGYDTTSLQLHYSTDAFATDTVKMDLMPTGETNMFSATIPNPEKGTVFSYYLTVTDIDERKITNPGEAPEKRFFQFIAATDDSIPEISHSPLDFLLPAENKLKINASITDFFTGVDTAYVEWSINDSQQETAGMTQDPEFPAGWEVTLNFSGLETGDFIKYQIIAIDKANIPQTAIAPEADDFYIIPIEGVPDPTLSYETDFNEINIDFLGNQFEISTPPGFTDGALNSPHPYENAGEGNEINYITQLKVPIIIDENNPVMEFEEIVLVEPGEAGTVFGQQEFWDYVVVEGTNDEGENWIPLIPGYDSRADAIWLNRYNSGLDSQQNSNATGEPALYRKRTIDLLENGVFKAGETILIRFRLFSDPFAFGWGWAIDNLMIQGEPMAISDFLNSEDDFRIYPNPSADGLFTLNARFSKPVSDARLKVLDTMGRVVFSEELPSGTGFSHPLDLSNQPPGIYIINTSIGADFLSKKVIKSN